MGHQAILLLPLATPRGPSPESFRMLYAYTKQEQGDLTPQQVKVLSRLVREEFK